MKNILLTTFSLIAILSIASNSEVFAEEPTRYKMADDVGAVMTFTFRDGVEVHEFPVFTMTSDLVSNVETSFEVKGVVGDGPYLHKALDDAFKYRLMKSTGAASMEYNYRYFDVEVNLVRNDESFQTIQYRNCEILNYQIETLNSNDYESYLSSKSGFAIVDDIEFFCSGLNFKSNSHDSKTSATSTVYDHGTTSYDFAEDVHTFVIFQFDNGIEKIEFPTFKVTSGFEEDGNASSSFFVEGIVDSHPLLDDAIGNARKVQGLHYAFNADFDVMVEFIKGDTTLRGINYADCRVTSAKIVTLYDKEEGFTGKRGFALVNQMEITCAGMTPQNPNYDTLSGDTPIWKTTLMTNEQMVNDYNMGHGPHAVASFTFNNGIETINFPMFEQGDLLSKSNPTFELGGIVGDYPLLYKLVDDAAKISQRNVGATSLHELFDVDVQLVYGEQLVRKFNYNNCRVTDYVVETQTDKEETYFKGFALSNTFDFECQGYHPNSPVYDAMFNTYEKAKTISTNDLRNTDDWGPGFYVK